MQQRSRNTEPETLRVHREMYERRLRDMETGSSSSKKEVDAANSPAVLEHKDSEPESENPTTKAAASLNY
jgi:hypothetical protein